MSLMYFSWIVFVIFLMYQQEGKQAQSSLTVIRAAIGFGFDISHIHSLYLMIISVNITNMLINRNSMSSLQNVILLCTHAQKHECCVHSLPWHRIL